jgi:hypothetical protein
MIGRERTGAGDAENVEDPGCADAALASTLDTNLDSGAFIVVNTHSIMGNARWPRREECRVRSGGCKL